MMRRAAPTKSCEVFAGLAITCTYVLLGAGPGSARRVRAQSEVGGLAPQVNTPTVTSAERYVNTAARVPNEQGFSVKRLASFKGWH